MTRAARQWQRQGRWQWRAITGTTTTSVTRATMTSSTGVFCVDDPVECLHHVGAAVALARVTTVAWTHCLGAGAVTRGAGGSH
jgi:hypothetical protein